MNERVDVPSKYEIRARGFLRWYPPTWRERYGEEFVAHLESEIAETPYSLRRSVDVAFHGVLTRLQLQRALRFFSLTGAFVSVAAFVALIVAALSTPPAPVLLGTDTTGAVFHTGTSQWQALTFTFKSPARERIRILGVSVVSIPGQSVPLVGPVDISSLVLNSVDPQGWPPRLAQPDFTGGAVPILRNAMNTLVTLRSNNTLVVGFRTPVMNRAYGVEGIIMTYLHDGHRYSSTISRHGNPVVMCTASQSGPVPLYCSVQFAVALASEASLHPLASWKAWTSDELILNSLYDSVFSWSLGNHHIMTLAQLKYFAHFVAPSSSPTGIDNITLTRGVFHVTFRDPGAELITQLCIRQPTLNRKFPGIAQYFPMSCSPGATPLQGPQYEFLSRADPLIAG